MRRRLIFAVMLTRCVLIGAPGSIVAFAAAVCVWTMAMVLVLRVGMRYAT